MPLFFIFYVTLQDREIKVFNDFIVRSLLWYVTILQSLVVIRNEAQELCFFLFFILFYFFFLSLDFVRPPN